MGALILLITFILLAKGILYITSIQKSKKNPSKYRKKLGKILSIDTVFNILNGTHLDIYLAIFINFLNYKSGDGIADLNLFTSMISLFILLYILVFFLFKTSKVVECIRSRRNDLKSIYGSYMFLSDGLKMNSSFSQYYKVIFLIKDPIIAFTIVVLSHHPILQISLTFFTTFYLFIQEAHHKPQLNKIDHRISVMNSFLFTGVIGFYMAVYLQQDSIEVK